MQFPRTPPSPLSHIGCSLLPVHASDQSTVYTPVQRSVDTGRALLAVLGFVIGGTIGFFLERAEERARRRGGGLAVLLLTRALEGVPIGFLIGAIISDRVGATNANVYLIVGSIAGAALGILIEWAGRNVSDEAGLLVMRILRAIYKGGMAGVSGATVGLAYATVSLLQNPPSVSASPGSTTGNPVADVIHAAAGLTVSDLITLALMYIILAALAGFGAVVGAIIGLIDGILLEFSWRPAKH